MTGSVVFRNRRHAGQVLAGALGAYGDRPDVVVLALPRGGVPVGFEVAKALHAPLEVLIVRKVGEPGFEEYAIGAIASGGVQVLNEKVIRQLGIDEAAVKAIVQSEEREIERRERLYRGDRPALDVRGRTVILVDDGLATGLTMLAAIEALQVQQPGRLVVAVPTGAAETCEDLRARADEVICVATPAPFRAVGLWYEDFLQTSDAEVRQLLGRAHALAAIP